MSVPVKVSVLAQLEPFAADLVDIIREAWKRWQAHEFSAHWHKRGRANFLWEEMVGLALAQFTPGCGVVAIEKGETVSFVVNQQVLFRFKKGDEAGVSRNVRTGQAIAFHDHSQVLLDLPQVSRVELVYQLNQLETAILDIMIVARQGKTILWKHSLLQAQSQVIPLLAGVPKQPQSPAEGEGKRVRVRKASSKNADNSEHIDRIDKDAQQP